MGLLACMVRCEPIEFGYWIKNGGGGLPLDRITEGCKMIFYDLVDILVYLLEPNCGRHLINAFAFAFCNCRCS